MAEETFQENKAPEAPRKKTRVNPAETVRQSLVIMKNEIKKFFSGKRMRVFSIILAVIVFILAVAPYLVGSEAKAYMFVSIASLVVLMASTLFASISIVSEYEERTALIVFTRPISKTSIFIGKALACLVVTIAFIVLYYVIATLVGLAVDHSVNADMYASMGMACMYAFATTGIAMLVSSLLKKASTSTIITFVTLAIILTAASMVLGAADMDTSWMLTDASESIEYASSDYRTFTNDLLDQLRDLVGDPTTFLVSNWEQVLNDAGYDPNVFLVELNMVWGLSPDMVPEFADVPEPDYAHDAVVMLCWGLVAFVLAFVAFLRRQF